MVRQAYRSEMASATPASRPLDFKLRHYRRERSRSAASASHMASLPGQPVERGERVGEERLVVHAAAEAAVLVDEGAGEAELGGGAGHGPGRGVGDEALQLD